MTSGNNLEIRKAAPADLAAVKRLADAHRHELGFVLLPSLRERIDQGEMLVAERGSKFIGFVDYHRRKDGQITLYHIAVEPGMQQQGIGRALIDALREVARETDCSQIALKCPTDLQANEFYQRYGFQLNEIQDGRKRPLNLWRLTI